MKNDFFFKFVAAILIAGVIVAFTSPQHPAPHHSGTAPETPAAAPSTE